MVRFPEFEQTKVGGFVVHIPHHILQSGEKECLPHGIQFTAERVEQLDGLGDVVAEPVVEASLYLAALLL